MSMPLMNPMALFSSVLACLAMLAMTWGDHWQRNRHCKVPTPHWALSIPRTVQVIPFVTFPRAFYSFDQFCSPLRHLHYHFFENTEALGKFSCRSGAFYEQTFHVAPRVTLLFV